MKKLLFGIIASLLLASPVYADSVSINFESPTYTTGVINGQDGWKSLGAAGSGCALYDHAVSGSLTTPDFGDQSLRISNAVTSGCFGDMTFAKPLTDAVGEIDSTAGSFSTGTLQRHFEMTFDIASTVPGSQQPGLFVSVSPDRGDGSRMSYLGFSDESGGIDIIFYDVQGTEDPANFVETDLGTYDRSVSHHIKLTFDAIDGPSNDVVKVWIDGDLKHTGTSWENYYRYDSEASAEQSPRIVKTVIFRTGGSNAPDTSGNGFLFDNFFELSGPNSELTPTKINQCMQGGWNSLLGYGPFKNQGSCVSYFANGKVSVFTASDSRYFSDLTGTQLYATGPISFAWDPKSGEVLDGYWYEIHPAFNGTTYVNLVTGGLVEGNNVHLDFLRHNGTYTFSFSGTLIGNFLTGNYMAGPFLFKAMGD